MSLLPSTLRTRCRTMISLLHPRNIFCTRATPVQHLAASIFEVNSVFDSPLDRLYSSLEHSNAIPEQSNLTSISTSLDQRKRKTRKLTSKGSATTRSKTRRRSGSLAFYNARWVENFEKLKAYVARTGQKNGTSNFSVPDNKQLRMWMTRQKLEYRKNADGKPSLMTEERKRLLDSLGFSFHSLRERSWEKMYQRLCAFAAKHDGILPYDFADIDSLDSEGQRLFHWCQHQRVWYNVFLMNNSSHGKTLMTQDRVDKLNHINFAWSMRDAFWEEKYRELMVYYRHHGDCLVPAAYVANPSLSKWVERQRSQYLLLRNGKPNAMTPQRLDRLNEINFIWDANDFKWQSKYNELVEYQQHNGHAMLPRKNDIGMASLCRWLKYQQKAYNKLCKGEKSSLTRERKELLDQLGIQWKKQSEN